MLNNKGAMMNSRDDATTYWNPYVAGVALGGVLFLSIFVTGAGLGGSGGVSRVMSYAASSVAPLHVDRNPYLASLAGGAMNPLDHRMVWMMCGVIAGGFISGLLARRTKVETIHGPHVSVRWRWGLAMAGGALMGWGAGLARGCTSGQALSGGAVLSLGSWAFMMMVFAGGYLIAYPLRRLWI